jgi:secreted trypsin-like serine protease
MTAAHCVVPGSRDEYVSSVAASVNSTGLFDSPYEYIRTATVLAHPLYSPDTFLNDIALLFLDDPVTGVPLVKINLNASLPLKSQSVAAIGLGLLQRPPEVEATYLMQANIKALAGSVCVSTYGSDSFRDVAQICAGDAKNICQGDSGGPLLVEGSSASKDTVVSITSFSAASGCGLYPSGFTRVSRHSAWINSNICQYSAYKPATCK